MQSFPGKESNDPAQGKRINIARIFDQKYNIILDKMYQKVDVTNFEGTDEPEDINGYLGKTKFYRLQKKLWPISDKEFINIIRKNNKMDAVMRTIKEIDKDHNGYVTRTELDDILKMYYPPELDEKDMNPIIKRFGSIQNKILIDYKAFKKWVNDLIAAQGEHDEQLKLKIQKLEDKVYSMKQKEDMMNKKIKDYSDY